MDRKYARQGARGGGPETQRGWWIIPKMCERRGAREDPNDGLQNKIHRRIKPTFSIFIFMGFSALSYKQRSTKCTLSCVLMQTILSARSLRFTFLLSFSLSNSAKETPPPKKIKKIPAKIKPNLSRKWHFCVYLTKLHWWNKEKEKKKLPRHA